MSLYPYRHRKPGRHIGWRTVRNVLGWSALTVGVAGVALIVAAPVGWLYAAVGVVMFGVALFVFAIAADRQAEVTSVPLPPAMAFQPHYEGIDSAPTTPLRGL